MLAVVDVASNVLAVAPIVRRVSFGSPLLAHGIPRCPPAVACHCALVHSSCFTIGRGLLIMGLDRSLCVGPTDSGSTGLFYGFQFLTPDIQT